MDTEFALLAEASPSETAPLLRAPSEGQKILADFRSTVLSLRRHPVALLRDRLIRRRVQSAKEVLASENGAEIRGRRWRALQRLVQERSIKKSYGVPCRVISIEEALHASIAENSGRRELHPADQFEGVSLHDR